MRTSRIVMIVLTVFSLASCAQYSVKTSKSSNFIGKIKDVYVWSAVGDVVPFRKKLLFSSNTFENQFNSALSSKLTALGIKNRLRYFSPSIDKNSDLARFEVGMHPNYRLVIFSPQYSTITAEGATNVDVLHLNVILTRTTDNHQIWENEIVVNTHHAPGAAWRDAGAKKLAQMIIDALKKDGLV